MNSFAILLLACPQARKRCSGRCALEDELRFFSLLGSLADNCDAAQMYMHTRRRSNDSLLIP